MPFVCMLGNFQTGPESHFTGEVVEVSEEMAKSLIAWQSARLATPEDLGECKNPLPAALVREQISKAIPDGPRPHRRRG